MYIHDARCISPQQTFPEVNLEEVKAPVQGFLAALDPGLGKMDRNTARRMSRPVRMGMTLAMELLESGRSMDGLIFATASAGNAAAMQFLKQIAQYDEGLLTPGDFVQSSPHALAGQIASVLHTNCYTNTHVHGGSAFEHALMDAMLLLEEKPTANMLVGAMDEFSDYNHRIHIKAGWYDDRDGRNARREDGRSAIGGEGCALFRVNGHETGARARLRSILTFHADDPKVVAERTISWLRDQKVDMRAIGLLSGITDDSVTRPVYDAVMNVMDADASIHQYKHLCGEYPTASAFALWLTTLPGPTGSWPAHMVVRNGKSNPSFTLVHHAYKGLHQSLMLVETFTN